jgi:hypothetical protein
MTNVLLKDILINARQESFRMRHFYLGVEHLFIALLEIQGGLTSGILADNGLAPEYVVDAIRRRTGKGSKHRLWAGMPYTPRAEVVLGIANDIALENEHEEIEERDLLLAICEEKDSIPIRVLKSLKLDAVRLAEAARTREPSHEIRSPDIRIEFGPDFDRNDSLSKEQLFILRRMFYGYAGLRIERRLTGFTKALILAVTPIDAENQDSATVVVKIDQTDNILDEAQRYENHVKDTLPLLTARLEDRPTAPDTSDLAGIKYTLVASSGAIPQDLRSLVRTSGAVGLGQLLRQQLYSHFSKTWWQKRRSYRFEVWKEYDWLLPPVLTLELVPDKEDTAVAQVMRVPFNRTKFNARLSQLEYGDFVALENFTVQRVDREHNVLKLAAGYGTEADKRAYKVEVQGFDLDQDVFYRGEVVDRLVGRVWKTRDETLTHAARMLEPDFDLQAAAIPWNSSRLPNPLLAYEGLLDRHVTGSLSKIHGDLHLGNILVGPNNSTWLIDFAHTRDGHTLFDWATLEVSLLGDAVMPAAGESWQAARGMLEHLAAINSGLPTEETGANIRSAMSAVAALREIVQECLMTEADWSEYFIALSLCALRAVTFETMFIGGRRLMFLLTALTLHELRQRNRLGSTTDTSSPDESDITEVVGSISLTTPSRFRINTAPQKPDFEDELLGEEPIPEPTPDLARQRTVGATEHLSEGGLSQLSGDIYFSAYYPNELTPDVWRPFYAYMFRQFAAREIADDVQDQVGEFQDAFRQVENFERGTVSEGEAVTAIPFVEGIEFSPSSVAVRFRENWQRFDFRVRAHQDQINRASNGYVTFSMGGVIVGDLPISILVGQSESSPIAARATRRLYDSIFASYSQEDSHVVQRVEAACRALGLDYLREVMSLRSGQDWNDLLFELIEQADIFQLFWSQSAANSPYVEREWRHALQLHSDRRNFIHPVYWTEPMPAAPSELSHLRFTFRPELGR